METEGSFLSAVSRLLGWTYVLCWSLSFYPQAILNWRRKSTVGLTLEFPVINVLGFLCYSISCATFLYSPLIRSQYASRSPGSSEPTVRVNDLAFGVHATVLSVLTCAQFFVCGYRRDAKLRFSRAVAGVAIGCVLGIVSVVFVVYAKGVDGGRDPSGWAWIDVVYSIGYVKLLVTVIKYIPQAWTNYRRKSTAGWSISQILLDFSGGVLSILQLVIDSSLQGDWSGITGNPVKLGLGNVSILFDIVFITQHYVLYGEKGRGRKRDEEERRLLDGEE